MTEMIQIDTGDDMATRIVAVVVAVSGAAEELKAAAQQLLEAGAPGERVSGMGPADSEDETLSI